MLDLNFVRENLPLVEEKLRQRGMDPAAVLKDFREVDTLRRQAITEAETSKAQRNKASEEIAKLKKSGQDASAAMAQTKELRENISGLEKTAGDLDVRLRDIMAGIPNLPHASVPIGHSADDNVEVRRWGIAPKFDFTPKPHWDLGPELGDPRSGTRGEADGCALCGVLGSGGEAGTRAGEFHARSAYARAWLHGSSAAVSGEFGVDVRYRTASEICSGSFSRAARRKRFVADLDGGGSGHEFISRRSAGSGSLADFAHRIHALLPQRGGIIRERRARDHPAASVSKSGTGEVHASGKSYEEHEKLTRNAEEVLQKLGLHYRVMALCTGDMSAISAKTYDIEVWLPGQQLYREISSCSNFEAYQARRANIRYRPEGKNKPEFVHTLNGSALAVGRTWVAIVENYQQSDGSVVIPEVLRPYMGAERITKKSF